MSDIVNDLQSLTPEEMAQVGDLIAKLASKESVPVPKKRKNKQNHKKNKTKKKAPPQDELVVKHGPGRASPRQTIVTSEHEVLPTKKSMGQGRTAPREEHNQQGQPEHQSRHRNPRRGNVRRGRGGGKVQARTEAVQLSGGNKFLQMRDKRGNLEREKKKEDTQFDKKVWEDRIPMSRPDEYQPVEVQCNGENGCGLWFDVDGSMVHRDHETSEVIFTCNGCARRG